MLGFYLRRTQMANEPERRTRLHIPMIYEHPAPPRWEYHVLTVQPAENGFPNEEILNALGQDGWILAGLLDERMSGNGQSVHYYFVREFTR